MKVPILQSKLLLPQLPPRLVGDQRLKNLSEGILQADITVITAPAGYGKTTLMAAALHEAKARGRRSCWYRLGKEDRDLAVFYTHLLEALFPASLRLNEGRKAGLADWGDLFSRYQFVNAEICRALWETAGGGPQAGAFIAFDDFHQIMDIPEIFLSLQFLFDNLPDNYAVLVGSRHETGILTGRRRLEKKALDVGHRDLCFSVKETADLIKDRTRTAPPPDLVQKIMLHTEGWAAGIILVCQMLHQRDPGDTAGILDRLGKETLLFRYLASEVLNRTGEDLLRFLSRAALLGEFTATQASEILEESRAGELLEQCYQEGLFLQKTEEADSTFRIHSLFRGALLQVLPRYLSEDEVKALHLRAASYFMEHRIFDQAIRHFILGRHVEQAVELVTRESVRLLALDSVEELRVWFKFLPAGVVAANPFLLYIKSFIRYQSSTEDAMGLLRQALALFEQDENIVMQFHTLIAMAHLNANSNNVREIRKIRARIDRLSGMSPPEPLRDMLLVFSFTMAVWEEKLAKSSALFRLVQSFNFTNEWPWFIFFYSSLMYYMAGDLDRAEKQIRETLNLDVSKGYELLRGHTLLWFSIILHLKDEQSHHPHILQEMEAIGEKQDNKYIQGMGRRLAAYTCYRRHDLEGALDNLEMSSACFAGLHNTALVSVNSLCRGLWLCGRRDPKELLQEAHKPLKTLLGRPAGQCLQELGLSLYGVIAREAGDLQGAEAAFLRALKRNRSKGAHLLDSGIYLHLAKLYYDTGAESQGEEYLRRALDRAVEHNCGMFWDLHFPTLVEMALRCVRGGLHSRYMLALIERYYGSEGAAYLEREAAGTTDFREGTAAFLSLYGGRKERGRPAFHVTLFGRFRMTSGDEPVPGDEWRTKKTSGVFKFLLLHRNRLVSKERLMETFWPGTDKKLASMSLRAALYEVRKFLQKYSTAAGMETSFLVEKRDSLGVRTGENLSVDVDEFLSYASLARPGARDAEKHQAVPGKKLLLERMVSLYQGDLLEDVLYDDWVFAEREELRSVFLEAVLDLADLYSRDQDTRKAEKLLLKVLTLDEYNEEACLRLLQLLIAQNQRSRAVKLYAKFTDRFEKELNMKPDERLSALFKN